jgi:hypothetical protein
MNVKADISWVKHVEGEFEYADPWARFTEIAGLTIKHVRMGGDNREQLAIEFNEGRTLVIADNGQSCCESRYMTCDDDLSGHEGGSLLYVEMDAAAPPSKADVVVEPEPAEDDWDSDNCHETMFVKVQTTKGSFTLCTHNEHNGYYGGFSLEMTLIR